MIDLKLFWFAAIIFFGIVEAATVSLTVIWFAAGALAALICAFLGASLWIQLVAFIIVSAVCLAMVKPLAKKQLSIHSEPTNADRVIGQEALVTEDIDNILGTGAVQIGGIIWTARGLSQQNIPKGSQVVVKSIEGVKVLVEELPSA